MGSCTGWVVCFCGFVFFGLVFVFGVGCFDLLVVFIDCVLFAFTWFVVITRVWLSWWLGFGLFVCVGCLFGLGGLFLWVWHWLFLLC